MGKLDYVEVIYNEKHTPVTKYPKQLTRYLTKRFNLAPGSKFLDLGCGRGDFLKEFVDCGLDGCGIDQSKMAHNYCDGIEILTSDLTDALPYDDNSFDVVFSKSVLEHFYYPEKIVEEIRRILKPGGRVITMVPDWEAIYKTFYDDYTHRMPFTKISLKDLFVIHGFQAVESERFWQLPFLWRFKILFPMVLAIKWLIPSCLKKRSKLVRFSKEVMLLSVATKGEKCER